MDAHNLPFEPLTPADAPDAGCNNITLSGDSADNRNFQDNDDAQLVRETLRKIMQDEAAPAAAKAQAARTLAEMAQLLGRNQREPLDPNQPVREMGREALIAELAAMKGG